MLLKASCTASMHGEPQLRMPREPQPIGKTREKQPIQKKKPRNTGLFASSADFLRQAIKNWHAPCNNPITTQFRGPWYRQAGDSPFYTGLIEPTVLGALIQAGQGFPSLHPGLCAERAPSRFGDLGTGRPGIPSFIAPGDGSPVASGHRPRCRPTPPATDAPPPTSAIIPYHSNAPAS